ncbi:MAG TPA: pentapeptide repeat-containing protein [Lachnospiraceae bacterium]|nr:pentapeptide repeat-containing protein [Lachnospiraceae bacterium]
MTQSDYSNVHSKDNIISNPKNLKPKCEECFGLCCVALYFSEYDGFPTTKDAGTPCPNLQDDFRCKVHDKLTSLGLKGCIGYECLGAGQQISQVTFEGRSWKQYPELAAPMYEAFLIMRQLHEICWYLTEALSFPLDSALYDDIIKALKQTEDITILNAQKLKEYNITELHSRIKTLLGRASNYERNRLSKELNITFSSGSSKKSSPDYFGKDLRRKDIRCTEFRGACLIAANLEGMDCSGTDFIGADFRDTNIKGANLSRSIYLTQSQINVAHGDSKTKLPDRLSRPSHWLR